MPNDGSRPPRIARGGSPSGSPRAVRAVVFGCPRGRDRAARDDGARDRGEGRRPVSAGRAPQGRATSAASSSSPNYREPQGRASSSRESARGAGVPAGASGPSGARSSGDVGRMPHRTSRRRYFRTRPFGSRVGAAASPQSTVVPGREAFEAARGRAHGRVRGTRGRAAAAADLGRVSGRPHGD